MKPVQIGTDHDWADVSAGAGHSLGIKKDGSVWAWGQNESGQVGDGTVTNVYVPTRLSPESGWKTIAAGAFNGYAIKGDGTIWGWGLDFASGASRKSNSLTPVQLDAGTNWTRISASDYVLLGLKSDGTLWVMGQNASWVAGYYVQHKATNFTQIGTDTDWEDMSPGQGYFFARKRDGRWWACGANNRGELGFGASNLPPSSSKLQRVPYDLEPWAFATGYGTTLLLTRDGQLWTWGERLGTAPPSLSRDLKEIANKILNFFPGHLGRLTIKGEVTDYTPYPLWELPGSVRKSLGTNAASMENSETKH